MIVVSPIDNSGVNVFLISSSVMSKLRVTPIRTYLAWLAKAYCVYMGEHFQQPVQQTACSLAIVLAVRNPAMQF